MRPISMWAQKKVMVLTIAKWRNSTIRSDRFPRQSWNSKNRITALIILAVPALVYSFGIINWFREEIEKIDWKKWESFKLLKESTTQRQTLIFCIKGRIGGHGLVKLESAYNTTVVSLNRYIKQCKGRVTRLVQEYDTWKTKYSPQKEANLSKNVSHKKLLPKIRRIDLYATLKMRR
jgi:hypothetical protein